MKSNKELSTEQKKELLDTLEKRFEKNQNRHPDIRWIDVKAKLENHSENIWSLNEMEKTGGEPDVVAYDKEKNEYHFYDCATESPKGRRSLCYDAKALEERKDYKPDNNIIDKAKEMGIDLLKEEQYSYLQTLGNFDIKTSSWLKTPENIRKLGGAIFADFRYETVFIYHNGASSYYAARGFRGCLKV